MKRSLSPASYVTSEWEETVWFPLGFPWLGDASTSGRAQSPRDLDEIPLETWPKSFLGLSEPVPKSHKRWSHQEIPTARAGGKYNFTQEKTLLFLLLRVEKGPSE